MSCNFPKKLWEGKIPACFELAHHELSSSARPGLFYIMLPRSSYLTLFSETIREYFQEYLDVKKIDEIWFEYKEKTLRWHYPCGLLHDLYCDPASDLPWCITVHFQNFPESELIRCPSEDAVESHFMTVLKEADQLKHKGQIISDMNKNQHQQLWHGLKMNNFDEFWHINKKFMDGFEGTLSFRSIPIRIYFNGKIIQKLCSPISEDESDVTLYDALSKCIPSQFENNRAKESVSILIHGISPSLSTSLQWLSENMSYADNFLHICVNCS